MGPKEHRRRPFEAIRKWGVEGSIKVRARVSKGRGVGEGGACEKVTREGIK